MLKIVQYSHTTAEHQSVQTCSGSKQSLFRPYLPIIMEQATHNGNLTSEKESLHSTG